MIVLLKNRTSCHDIRWRPLSRSKMTNVEAGWGGVWGPHSSDRED